MTTKQKLSLGDVLRRRRRQLEMTQVDVAKKVGCRPNYVGYLESGARRPSQKVLLRLAKTLDLDPQELLLLANPEVRALVSPQPDGGESAWERFKANRRLHTRHGITRAELQTLKSVAMLGPIRNQRDFLFILQTIRQALVDE
jgi:transcriptional regulator with XRE-family HTH domain